jgi:hypothetical protein
LVVASVQNLSTSARLYNIEVDREHVFEVTTAGILVHNNNPLCAELLELRDKASKGLLTLDEVTQLAKLEAEAKTLVNIPLVNKVINSKMAHASQQAFDRQVLPGLSKSELTDKLRELSQQVQQNGLPVGTFLDPGNIIPRTDSILVPFGNGAAVYEVAKNGTARLFTVLGSPQVLAARQKLGL